MLNRAVWEFPGCCDCGVDAWGRLDDRALLFGDINWVGETSMSSRRCGLILATACLVLAACTSTVVEEQAAPPPPSVPEELSELDLERFPEDAESPEFGDERDAVLNVSSECRNGADTEAFGVPWFLANELLPEGLEGVETLNGVLRFESFEISTFEGEGYSVQMTFLMEIEDSCTLWPGSDGLSIS